MLQTLENEGRLWLRAALGEQDLSFFDEVSKSDSNAGIRLEWSDTLKTDCVMTRLNNLVEAVLKDAKPVRFVSFNKTSETNWSLPWHQDRVIAVKDKIETEGFFNWSQKAGIWHCEPPIKILDNMIFARVYLDDSDEESGCLELALGSHKYGKILSQDIERVLSKLRKETCTAKRGDVLLVKALTLHRSSISHAARNRRVLRIDYSNCDLPGPLEWKY